MIEAINSPAKDTWKSLITRPSDDQAFLTSSVKNVLNRVRTSGDDALKTFTEQFDKVSLDDLKVSSEEINEAENLISKKLKDALKTAYENIYKFHEAQKPKDLEVTTIAGVKCKLKFTPIENVGLYIPGGTAPLFSSVLMLAIPAHIAGCNNAFLCSPPNKEGKIHPAILYAAKLCGINKIFKVGGAQAIAAMAYGTETIPVADKIFGPGNQFVTMAKQLVNMEGVAIDMPAGPSEVAIFADETSNPEFIAADLLSQAEHGVDSQVLLVALNEKIISRTSEEIKKLMAKLPRKDMAEKAISNSKFITFKSAEESFDFINLYAPEHFIIASQKPEKYESLVKNAGSVFMGNLTPESAGDYASGTNHTLPTNGTARAYSGLSLNSFLKTITFQQIDAEGVNNLADAVETMAENEQLEAHRLAMALRRESLK